MAVVRKGTSKGTKNARPAPTTFGLEPPITLKKGLKGEEKANAKGGKGKGRGGGEGRGKGQQRNAKPQSKESKIPCKYFNNGNGYCRFADRYHHSHEVKGGKRKEAPALILSKKDKKMKKDIVAMVVKDLKSKTGQRRPKEDKNEDDDDDDLYNLVRGRADQSSLVIQRFRDEEDFIPKKNPKAGRERVERMPAEYTGYSTV